MASKKFEVGQRVRNGWQHTGTVDFVGPHGVGVKWDQYHALNLRWNRADSLELLEPLPPEAPVQEEATDKQRADQLPDFAYWNDRQRAADLLQQLNDECFDTAHRSIWSELRDILRKDGYPV